MNPNLSQKINYILDVIRGSASMMPVVRQPVAYRTEQAGARRGTEFALFV